MNITRNNYEEFFMLYADNELNTAQRKAVEAFVAANTDLQQELEGFQQAVLKPDEAVVFDNKEILMKQEAEQVSVADYESFFVLYADGELTFNEKMAVEDFVYRHPQLQQEFELLQRVKFTPDTHVVFADKKSLLRTEENDDKVIPFRWWRLAVAATLILFLAGIFWLNREKKNDPSEIVKNNHTVEPAKGQLPKAENIIAEQHTADEQPAREITAPVAATKDLQVKNIQTGGTTAKKEFQQHYKNIKPAVARVPEQDPVAINKNVSSVAIAAKHEQLKTVEIQKPSVAAEKKEMIDQQVTILTPDENDKAKAEFASLTNDNVEVLNTSVNTKSSLRGFLRKASRLIGRKANSGTEDGNKKNIFIGGFEIAVR